MALKVGQAFKRTSPNPIDEDLVLTKAQMLQVNDGLMPAVYFALCEDDGQIYIYKKDATPNAETGKYSVYGGGGSYDDTALSNRVTAVENTVADMYTKAEVIQEINDKLANYDKLDYKVADSPPTATEVVIKGQTVPVVEGTRYLVKHATDNQFEEYCVLDGEVYDFGNNSGAAAVLGSDLVVSNPIGKYTAEQTIPKDTPYDDIFRGILSKTYYPTLTPPSCSIPLSVPALAKVGQQINGGATTVSFNRGLIDPKYTADDQYRAGVATEYTLSLVNANVVFDETNADGQFVVPSFSKDSKGTVALRATVAHEAGTQPKDSDGANYDQPLPASSVSTTKFVEFVLPYLHGVSATFNVTDLTGMTEDLAKYTNHRTYSYDTNNEHMVFAYDAEYPELTEIFDPNNFPCITGFTSSIVTMNGQQYRVYVSNSPTTDTGARYMFVV